MYLQVRARVHLYNQAPKCIERQRTCVPYGTALPRDLKTTVPQPATVHVPGYTARGTIADPDTIYNEFTIVVIYRRYNTLTKAGTSAYPRVPARERRRIRYATARAFVARPRAASRACASNNCITAAGCIATRQRAACSVGDQC